MTMRDRSAGFVGLLGGLLVAACSSPDAGPPNAMGASGTQGTSGGATSGGASSGGASSGGASSGGAAAGGSPTSGGAGGSGNAAGGAAAGSAGVGGAATPSSGCGMAAPAEPPAMLEVTDQGARTFIVDVPASYDPATPMPLVFGFHGATQDGASFRSEYYGNLLSTLGDSFIVVHPDALGDPTGWEADRDIPFIDELITLLEGTYCVDETRIFATGHSSGGYFTNQLGCQRGDVFRAIAPVSGGGPGFGQFAPDCAGEAAAWIAHASNDMTVLFENGEGSRDYWAEANGCNVGESMPVSPAPCIEYAGCMPGLPVRFCVYADGHNWPDFGEQGIFEFFVGF